MSVAADRLLYRMTGGEWSITAVSRIPSLMLVVTRPDGDTAAVPLQYVDIDGSLYVVGTNWCRPNHPLWSSWLTRNPVCAVNIGGSERRCRALRLDGAERSAIWPKILHKSPYYDECERRARRQPRLFRLDPITDDVP
jgi:deazaflavin-dependent oxidoreductase (nitroreductase family)